MSNYKVIIEGMVYQQPAVSLIKAVTTFIHDNDQLLLDMFENVQDTQGPEFGLEMIVTNEFDTSVTHPESVDYVLYFNSDYTFNLIKI